MVHTSRMMSPSLSWAQRGWSMICFTTGPIAPSPGGEEGGEKREEREGGRRIVLHIIHLLHWSKSYACKQLKVKLAIESGTHRATYSTTRWLCCSTYSSITWALSAQAHHTVYCITAFTFSIHGPRWEFVGVWMANRGFGRWIHYHWPLVGVNGKKTYTV